MDSYKVYVNERLHQINDEKEIIDLLKIDDEYLINYLCDRIKQGTGPPVHPADIEGFLNIRRPQENVEINFGADYQSDDFTSYEEFEMSKDVSEDFSGCQEHEMFEGDESQQILEDKVHVWSLKGKALQADHKAIVLLLELRGSETFVKRFNDKKTSKLKLWKEISDKLCKKGYLADAEKCRQKFANLTKKYIEFVRHCNKTGNEKKKEPIYYDLLHKILGGKDKVHLTYIADTIPESLTPTVVVDEGDIEVFLTETPTACDTPSTSGVLKKRKEVLTKTDIMNKIVECNEKNIAIQQETTYKICAAIHEQTNLMQKQIDQKDRLLNIFEKFSKTRKRKRRSSSDSD